MASPFTLDDPTDGTFSQGNIMFELKDVYSQWRMLGIQLNVPKSQLDKIEKERPAADDCTLEMVSKWLEMDEKASWQKLINALVRIDKTVLAKDLEIQCKRRHNAEQTKEEGELPELEKKLSQQLEGLVLEKLADKRAEIDSHGQATTGNICQLLEQQLKETEGALVSNEVCEKEQRSRLKKLARIIRYLKQIVVEKKTREEKLDRRIRRLERVGGCEKELSERQEKLKECRMELKGHHQQLQEKESEYQQHHDERQRFLTTLTRDTYTKTLHQLYDIEGRLTNHLTQLRVRAQQLCNRIVRLEKIIEGGGELVAIEAKTGFDSGGYSVTRLAWGTTGAFKGAWHAIWGKNLEKEYDELQQCKTEKISNENEKSKCKQTIRYCEDVKQMNAKVLGTFSFLLEQEI